MSSGSPSSHCASGAFPTGKTAWEKRCAVLRLALIPGETLSQRELGAGESIQNRDNLAGNGRGEGKRDAAAHCPILGCQARASSPPNDPREQHPRVMERHIAACWHN